NLTRDRYINRLQASQGEWNGESYPSEGNLGGFISYALEGFRDGLDEQLATIETMQMRSIWRDEVDDAFRREFGDKLRGSRQRQKRLLLQLGDVSMQKPVKRNEVRQLTVEQAIAYDDKSMRTVQRDLNELARLGLLKREGDGYLPNKDILRAFAARIRTNSD
ncbi:MAG: DeoR family transcriptional regulator, partial [Chloroflexi bacterium]|nr:DeoR family transcriptional regulator [Chloroflexota bacterium]